jgi:NAD(P)H-hydrate epimerase
MAAAVVHHINKLGQDAEVVSVDIPSGMACTESSVTWPRVHAHLTITFQALKLAHVMPENGPALGAIRVGSIGLSETAIAAQSTAFYVTEEAEMVALLRPRSRFAHKGHFGRALLAGGSLGKVGAIALSAKACLRAGAGLVTAYVPKCGLEVLQTAVPEAMVVVDPDKKVLTSAPAIENYAAIGIGPGMGTTSESAAALQMLLEKAVSPVVLDADAINILGLYPAMQALVPPHSVLTPHAREFKRLAGTSANDFEALAKLMAVAKKLKSVVLFKGAYTCIASPEGQVYFNNTGNAGMATAGSGDALTGIIVSLMAQGYDSVEAARLGAWVHGLAGDMAAEALGEHGLIASDIIQYLPLALKKLSQANSVLAGSR